MAQFTIRGTRGTMPTCGESCLRYGGNTTCYSIRTGQGMVVIDAGTGISNVVRDKSNGDQLTDITLLFTHFHMDHLMGLPSFEPLHDCDTRLRIRADSHRKSDWKEDLRLFMRKPFWPVGLLEAQADMSLEDLPEDEAGLTIGDVHISWMRIPHPQQCLAYRIELPSQTIVIATDVEYAVSDIDPDFIEFCRGADHLIHDAQYTPDEFHAHRGWGHSTWETAATVAREAGVGDLILTHHDPTRSDDQVEELVCRAGGVFSPTHAASDNMVLGHN